MPGVDVTRVTDDSGDLYGKRYFTERNPEKYGFPDLKTRARTDLPERCSHWLRTILKYKVPPATVLELGAAHGGHVALLRWAGYDATGLELSPWLVEFARQTFGVPMLQGPLADQELKRGSLDVIALMDVLEHLPSPADTIRRCFDLLKPDGIVVVQTPRYPEAVTYEAMIAGSNPFLAQLKADEHVYLFSHQAIREFFSRIGVCEINFEPAIFAHYDMFFVASRVAPTIQSAREIEATLAASPRGRVIQALIDTHSQLREAERDRAERLKILETQHQILSAFPVRALVYCLRRLKLLPLSSPQGASMPDRSNGR